MAAQSDLPAKADEASAEASSRLDRPQEASVRRSWGALLTGTLAILLGAAVIALIASWAEQSRRAAALESQITTLTNQLAERDRLVGLQNQRIEAVRQSVKGLQDLLERPLTPSSD